MANCFYEALLGGIVAQGLIHQFEGALKLPAFEQTGHVVSQIFERFALALDREFLVRNDEQLGGFRLLRVFVHQVLEPVNRRLVLIARHEFARNRQLLAEFLLLRDDLPLLVDLSDQFLNFFAFSDIRIERVELCLSIIEPIRHQQLPGLLQSLFPLAVFFASLQLLSNLTEQLPRLGIAGVQLQRFRKGLQRSFQIVAG